MTGWYWKVKYVQNPDDSSFRGTVLRKQIIVALIVTNRIILNLGWWFFVCLFKNGRRPSAVRQVQSRILDVSLWWSWIKFTWIILLQSSFPPHWPFSVPVSGLQTCWVNWQSCMWIILWGKQDNATELMIHYFTLVFCFNRDSNLIYVCM